MTKSKKNQLRMVTHVTWNGPLSLIINVCVASLITVDLNKSDFDL